MCERPKICHYPARYIPVLELSSWDIKFLEGIDFTTVWFFFILPLNRATSYLVVTKDNYHMLLLTANISVSKKHTPINFPRATTDFTLSSKTNFLVVWFLFVHTVFEPEKASCSSITYIHGLVTKVQELLTVMLGCQSILAGQPMTSIRFFHNRKTHLFLCSCAFEYPESVAEHLKNKFGQCLPPCS